MIEGASASRSFDGNERGEREERVVGVSKPEDLGLMTLTRPRLATGSLWRFLAQDPNLFSGRARVLTSALTRNTRAE